MRSEKKYQIKIISALLVVTACASLYAWGGMSGKWLRRFVAPSVCAVYLSIINKSWIELIKAPLLGIASSLGYGADVAWLKIVKRGYVGLAFSLGSSITDIIRKNWLVVGFTTILCTSAYITFGVWNPVPARVEETLLGALVYTMAILPSMKE